MKHLSLITAIAFVMLLSACGTQEVKYTEVTKYKAVVIPKNMTTVPLAPQPVLQELYIMGKDQVKATVKEREEYLADYINELLKDRRGLETQFKIIEDYQTKMVKKIEEQNHADKPN